MTDVPVIDPIKAGKLAQEIVALLHNESPEMRRRAIQAALITMGEATPEPVSTVATQKVASLVDNQPHDLGAFFDRGDQLKPSDYALLCAAYHYSLYGNAPFSIEDARSIARDAGVVLPDRLDMTFVAASQSGKKLFQRAGRSTFKPTASAGLAFKERWNVKPGNQLKPSNGK